MDYLKHIEWISMYSYSIDYLTTSLDTLRVNFNTRSNGERIYICLVHIVWPVFWALLCVFFTRRWMMKSLNAESKLVASRYIQLESRIRESLQSIKKTSRILKSNNRIAAANEATSDEATTPVTQSPEEDIANKIEPKHQINEMSTVGNTRDGVNDTNDGTISKGDSLKPQSNVTTSNDTSKEEILTKRDVCDPKNSTLINKTTPIDNTQAQVVVVDSKYCAINALDKQKIKLRNSPKRVNIEKDCINTLKTKGMIKVDFNSIGDGQHKNIGDMGKCKNIRNNVNNAAGDEKRSKKCVLVVKSQIKPTAITRTNSINQKNTIQSHVKGKKVTKESRHLKKEENNKTIRPIGNKPTVTKKSSTMISDEVRTQNAVRRKDRSDQLAKKKQLWEEDGKFKREKAQYILQNNANCWRI